MSGLGTKMREGIGHVTRVDSFKRMTIASKLEWQKGRIHEALAPDMDNEMLFFSPISICPSIVSNKVIN